MPNAAECEDCAEDLTVHELAKLIANVVGFTGEIVTDPAFSATALTALIEVPVSLSLGSRPEQEFQD